MNVVKLFDAQLISALESFLEEMAPFLPVSLTAKGKTGAIGRMLLKRRSDGVFVFSVNDADLVLETLTAEAARQIAPFAERFRWSVKPMAFSDQEAIEMLLGKVREEYFNEDEKI